MERMHNNQVKKVGAGIEVARKNILNNMGVVSENVQQIKNNFSQLEGVIKGQTSTMQSLEGFHSNMVANNNRNVEAKKFLNRIYQKFKADIKIYVQLFKDYFISNNKKNQNWEKLISDFEKGLSSVKQGAKTLDQIFMAIERILSAKDQLMSQFIKVMLYKKHLLWKDMNVPYQSYVHGEIKAIMTTIKVSEEKHGYVPSSMEYKLPKFNQTLEDTSSLPLVQLLMNDFQEVIEAVQNYSNLRGEVQAVDGISKNQKVVLSLREQIETLTNNYQHLMDKYRNLQISKGRGSQQNAADKLEQVQNNLIKKEQQIVYLNQTKHKVQTQLQALKQKNKELEDQISKWHNHQLPKIKDLQQSQKSLLEEFTKVRKDLQAYNSIFQSEREDKTKIIEELKDQKTKTNGLVTLLGKEKRKVKQLKGQIMRQQKINLQLVDYLPDDIGQQSH